MLNVPVAGNMMSKILIGGGGNDTLKGRGGNDLIDGDAWLNVQLQVPDLAGGPQATKFVNSLTEVRAQVLAGDINPADFRIVRSIVRTPGASDVAVYSGLATDYTIGVSGNTVTVTDIDALPEGRISDGVDILRGIEEISFQGIDGLNAPAPSSVSLTAVSATVPVLPTAAAPIAAVDPQPLARTNNSIPRAACIAGIADAPAERQRQRWGGVGDGHLERSRIQRRRPDPALRGAGRDREHRSVV